MNDVRLYSNAPSAELLINGASQGVRSDCPDKVCTWTGMRLTVGANTITARGRFADGVVEDQMT